MGLLLACLAPARCCGPARPGAGLRSCWPGSAGFLGCARGPGPAALPRLGSRAAAQGAPPRCGCVGTGVGGGALPAPPRRSRGSLLLGSLLLGGLLGGLALGGLLLALLGLLLDARH